MVKIKKLILLGICILLTFNLAFAFDESFSPDQTMFLDEAILEIENNCDEESYVTLFAKKPGRSDFDYSSDRVLCNLSNEFSYTLDETGLHELYFIYDLSNSTQESVVYEFEVKPLQVEITSDTNFDYIDSAKTFNTNINVESENITYTWQIIRGEEIIFSETQGKSLTYDFTIQGNYHIDVYVEDAFGNTDADRFEVIIKAPSKVWFLIYDEENPDEPVENALIEISGQKKHSDSLGGAIFFLEETVHFARIEHEDYETRVKYVDIKDDSQTETLYLIPEDSDDDEPEVDILSLDEVDISSSKTPVLTFRVYDDSDVDCSLYAKDHESYKWILEKAFRDIDSYKDDPRSVELVYEFQKPGKGVRIDWKLECEDEHENEMEYLAYFKVSGTSSSSDSSEDDEDFESESVSEEKVRTIINRIQKSIDNARETKKEFDTDQLLFAELYSFDQTLNLYEKELTGATADLTKIRKSDLDLDKKDDQYSDIIKNLESVEGSLPIDIVIEEKVDGIILSSVENQEQLLAKYGDSELPESSISKFIKENVKLEESLKLEIISAKVTFTTFDNEVYSVISFESESDLFKLIQIPGDISKVQKMQGFTKVGDLLLMQEKEAQVLLKDESVKVDSVKVAVFKEGVGNSITGEAITDNTPLTKSLPKAAIITIIVIALTGVYTFYNYDVSFTTVTNQFSKVGTIFSKEKDPEILKLFAEVNNLKGLLKAQDIQRALKQYEEINSIYRTLDLNQKGKAQKKTKDIYGELMGSVATKLLDDAADFIAKNKLGDAKDCYDSFKGVFAHVSDSAKQKLEYRSMWLGMQIDKHDSDK